MKQTGGFFTPVQHTDVVGGDRGKLSSASFPF